jgi:hypothetical protein
MHPVRSLQNKSISIVPQTMSIRLMLSMGTVNGKHCAAPRKHRFAVLTTSMQWCRTRTLPTPTSA